MVIKTYIDFTGSIILQWHIKQALDMQSFDLKDTMLISADESRSIYGKGQSDSKSRVSAVTHKTSSEVGEALRKVLIKKPYKNDPS